MTNRSGFGAAALAALSLLALGSCAPQSRTLATVGGRQVTVADLEDAARRMPPGSVDPSPGAKRQLLDDLVNRSLLVGEARRLGYDQGAEFRTSRKQAEEETLPEMLYRRVVTDRVKVSEAEVKAVWDAQDKELGVSQIFSLTERDARAAADRLAAGDSFAAVARRLSRDRVSAPAGGALGYVIAGQMPTEIEQAVRDLPVGKWVGPLKTQVGYYIVQVTERRPRQREPYNDVRASLEDGVRRRKERALVMDYVAGLKTRYAMKKEPAGYEVLARKWQNRPAEEILAAGGDMKKLGFSDADLALPLASYKGGAYTVGDFFANFSDRSALGRPPAQDDPALQLFVEDRTTFRLLLLDARARGLAKEPETLRRIRDREESYLITRLYEQVIVPAAKVTDEERERIRVQAAADKSPAPQVQGQLADQEARLYESKRRKALDDLVAKLRKDHPPQIDEKALTAVPWPVPPKEKA